MKIFLIAAVQLVMLISTVWGHPGKTDSVGGHRCMKLCENWDLFYKEYHLHDKEGKAIRVSKNKKPVIPRLEREILSAMVATSSPVSQQVRTETVIIYRVNTIEQDDILFSNPLLVILLFLLLLLLILRINRKNDQVRNKNSAS